MMRFISFPLCPATPMCASGVYCLPSFSKRMEEIKVVMTQLYREDRLEALAAIDMKELVAGMCSTIPLSGKAAGKSLMTTDHHELIASLRQAPAEPKQKGEAVFYTTMELYVCVGALPVVFQQVLDAYLVETGLLHVYRPKYL